MPHAIRLLSIGILLLALGACTSKPVLNPHQPAPAGREFSQVQMQRAILDALNKRGWTATQVEPSRINAAITVRGKHHAEIGIDYGPSDFHIRYLNSWGLDYDEGKIHRNYNRWVNNLRVSILQELQYAN